MPNKLYSIGLTGGIGSGKSTAVSFFKEYGAGIIDSDEIAHALVEKDKPAYQAIVDHFSETILDSDDTINRSVLRQIIFDHPEEKQWLESCLHPLIHQEIKRQLEAFTIASKTDLSDATDNSPVVPYVIVDIPLLLNRKEFSYLNRILVIDCPESLQMKRLCTRDGLTESAAKQIINAQISRQKRNMLADDYILNDKDVEELRKTAYHLHKKYCEHKY